jgi:hypothetical protein
MLSIGTFGTRAGQELKRLDGFDESCSVGVDELKKLQEELRLLMSGRVTTAEETNRTHHLHLHLERLLECTSHAQNGGTVSPKSIRKPLTSAFKWFMPKPSFREPVPEVRLNEVHRNCNYSWLS